MAWFLIDPDQRTCEEVPEGTKPSGTVVAINRDGINVSRGSVEGDPAWVLLEGVLPQPLQGPVLIASTELTYDEVVEMLDFGTVQQLGPIRMFRGDRNRREVI